MQRRQFINTALAATAVGTILRAMRGGAADTKPASPAATPEFKRKIKAGFVGGGGRGRMIASMFKQHGGYEPVAVADYFQPVADNLGNALGVDPARRFSGLSGFKRVIESGIEALVIEDIPYFFPKQAQAAVDAGLHVYIAKPVAVDVPGCLGIEGSGKLATRKQRVFLVDYQIPSDPVNIAVVKAIHEGALGKLAQVHTYGVSGGFSDPPRTATIESRLQNLIWVNDVALGCDNIGNFDIHAIDAALWVIGQRPVSAMGSSQIRRQNPHSDARDVCSVLFEYAGGLVHNHYGQALANSSDNDLSALFSGTAANAQIKYWGKSFVRGGPQPCAGKVEDLYHAGAVRNIATFYQKITEAKFDNDTVPRAVDGALTCILGREAAARHAKLTMEDLLKENRRLEVDLKGLKA